MAFIVLGYGLREKVPATVEIPPADRVGHGNTRRRWLQPASSESG
jgi:hypothetical protein